MIRPAACIFLLNAVMSGCLQREPPGQCFAYCTGEECLLCDATSCVPVEPYQAWSFPACGSGAEPGEPDRPGADAPAVGGVDDVGMDAAVGDHPGPDAADGCGGDPVSCPTAHPDPDLLCAHDGQCAGGDCREGYCHAPCLADGDCGTGDVCASGFCVRDPAPATTCTFSSECQTAEVCVDGTCFLACGVDENCPDPADFCDRGLCRPDWRRVSECGSGLDCAESEDCVDGQCLTACFHDADCVGCADGPFCGGGYCGGEP